MFKKLMELFGGGSDEGVEQLDGSYLEHLLEEVRPRVRDALEREPRHDPLWLVAAEVFRASGGDSLEGNPYRGPVRNPDEIEEGAAQATPSTPEPPAGDSDETQEFEQQVASEEVDDETGDSGREEQVDQETAGPPEPPPAPTVADSEASDGSGGEAGGEVELADQESRETEETRIDSPPMLRTAMVFLGLLADNARLPDGLQMSGEDIQRVRTLLLGYFLGKDDVAMRANELMGVVETKFSEGYYSQARMLLELFGVHRETRLENDRKLFFREMNLKALGGRSPQQSVEIADELPEQLRQVNRRAEGAFAPFFDWYASATGIEFDVCARSAQSEEDWREVLAPVEDEEAVRETLSFVPPEQWRPPGAFEAPTAELITDQLDLAAGLDIVERYVGLAYFVLRAVGDTGLESYLESFFDWSQEAAGVDAVGYLPTLHREISESDRLVGEILGDVVVERYEDAVQQHLAGVGTDEVHDALETAVERLQDLNLDTVAPAYYDLGGVVADYLWEMETPTPELHLKLHRLT